MGTGSAGLDCSGYSEGADGQPLELAPPQPCEDTSTSGQGGTSSVAQQMAGLGLQGGASEVAEGEAEVGAGMGPGAGGAGNAGGSTSGKSGDKVWPEDMDELLELTLLQVCMGCEAACSVTLSSRSHFCDGSRFGSVWPRCQLRDAFVVCWCMLRRQRQAPHYPCLMAATVMKGRGNVHLPRAPVLGACDGDSPVELLLSSIAPIPCAQTHAVTAV